MRSLNIGWRVTYKTYRRAASEARMYFHNGVGEYLNSAFAIVAETSKAKRFA